jgi:membrane-associated phospholipid phosphatase
MQKILMILLWPVGLAVIIGIGAFLASRARATASHQPAHPHARPHGRSHAYPVARRSGHRGSGRRAAGGGPAGGGPASGGPASGGPPSGHLFRVRLLSGRSAVTRFLVTLLAGAATVYVIGALIGIIVVHLGPSIDKPIWHWTVSHQAGAWVRVMKKATQTAATFTVAGAAVTAAVCLVFVWGRDRWLPPTALAALIVVDHYLTMALTDTFNRVPPPHSGGTFPSGASDRAVAYYGLIAFLLWRAVSGRRKAAIWAAATVAALAFTESYSRGYLALHWFTDIAGGLVYGGLLLTAFIAAVNAATTTGQADGDVALAAPSASENTGAYAVRVPDGTATGSRAAGAPLAGARSAGAPSAGNRAGPVRRAASSIRIAGEGVA